jgi:hypothetical protein
LRFPYARPKSRVRGASESPSPSEVASSFEAAIPFRGPWFVVVPPDENDDKPVAILPQAAHTLSTIDGTTVCIFLSGAWDSMEHLQNLFTLSSTACGKRAPLQTMSRTRADAHAQSHVQRD